MSGNIYYGYYLIKVYLKEFVYLIGVRVLDFCRVKLFLLRFVFNFMYGGYSNVVKIIFNVKGIFVYWKKVYYYVIGLVVFLKNILGV